MRIFEQIKKYYQHFEWLALVRLFKKLGPKNINYFFKSSPSLGFPGREIAHFKVKDQDVIITANFLGLQGASSPLPLHFTEIIVQDDPDDSSFNELLNFFNQRFYEALIRIDQKYHYLVQLKPQYRDALTQNLQALAGLPSTHDKKRQELYYRLLPGLRYLAGGQLSKQGLCLFLQKLFGVERVSLKERVLREIFVPKGELNSLGSKSVLGTNIILGRRVYQRSVHLELHIELDAVERFLPESIHFKLLQELLAFVLRAPLWVRLVLHAKVIKLPILASPLRLGYNMMLTQVHDSPHRVSLALL